MSRPDSPNSQRIPNSLRSAGAQARNAAGFQVILLHAEAPRKPSEGAACNGCGVCCATEPCPVGILVTGRRRGTCRALRWHDSDGRYRCGMVSAPDEVLPWLPRAWSAWLSRMSRRWIAAGAGCDATLVTEPA